MNGYYGRNDRGELVPITALRIDMLARIRKRDGVKFWQQAEDMGLNVSTLYDYRCGNRTPEVYNLRRICDYYGASADWLIGMERGA